MGKPSKGQAVGLGVLLLVILAVTITQVYGTRPHSGGITMHEPRGADATAQSTAGGRSDRTGIASAATSIPSAGATTAGSTSDIIVHVAGGVLHPGIYHLRSGSRNNDAIQAAGGAVVGADPDAINLAAVVMDGTRIFVPMASQSETSSDPATTTSAPETSAAEGARRSNPSTSKLTGPGANEVDINSANSDELARLPGIGAAMAQRIIEYRSQNGPFTQPEDLRHVSGIGDRKLAKLLPYIRIQ